MVGRVRQHVNLAPDGDAVSGFFGIGGPVAKPVVTLTSVAGVLTIDLARGEYFQVTLTENITSVVVIGAPAGFGASFMLWITQHASSAKTFAMPAAFDWGGGTVGAISSTLSSVNLLGASTRNGTAWAATLAKDLA